MVHVVMLLWTVWSFNLLMLNILLMFTWVYSYTVNRSCLESACWWLPFITWYHLVYSMSIFIQQCANNMQYFIQCCVPQYYSNYPVYPIQKICAKILKQKRSIYLSVRSTYSSVPYNVNDGFFRSEENLPFRIDGSSNLVGDFNTAIMQV